MAAQGTEAPAAARAAFGVDQRVARAGRVTTDVTGPDPAHQDPPARCTPAWQQHPHAGPTHAAASSSLATLGIVMGESPALRP